jgi:molybdate transport system permease protein
VPPSIRDAALGVGASPVQVVFHHVLPLALPGVLAGCVLAWARSLGEFGATITFAGNFPGTTQTMPSLIYTTLQADPAAARTLSMLLLVVSIGVLVGLRRRWLVPS